MRWINAQRGHNTDRVARLFNSRFVPRKDARLTLWFKLVMMMMMMKEAAIERQLWYHDQISFIPIWTWIFISCVFKQYFGMIIVMQFLVTLHDETIYKKNSLPYLYSRNHDDEKRFSCTRKEIAIFFPAVVDKLFFSEIHSVLFSRSTGQRF